MRVIVTLVTVIALLTPSAVLADPTSRNAVDTPRVSFAPVTSTATPDLVAKDVAQPKVDFSARAAGIGTPEAATSAVDRAEEEAAAQPGPNNRWSPNRPLLWVVVGAALLATILIATAGDGY